MDESSPLEDLSGQAFEIAKRRQAALVELLQMLESDYGTWFESHAATVLHAAAWLAGTSLYRSLGYDAKIAPGPLVLSERANVEGNKLLKVFMALADREGIKLGPHDLSPDFTPEQEPRKTIGEVQARFQDHYNEIMQQHGFDYAEGAKTGAILCERLLKYFCVSRMALEPRVAASIVTMGFVEGVKTSPEPLKSAGE